MPVFLPGESHGQRSLAGYSPWGRRELDPTERLGAEHSACRQSLGRRNPEARGAQGPSAAVMPSPLGRPGRAGQHLGAGAFGGLLK